MAYGSPASNHTVHSTKGSTLLVLCAVPLAFPMSLLKNNYKKKEQVQVLFSFSTQVLWCERVW